MKKHIRLLRTLAFILPIVGLHWRADAQTQSSSADEADGRYRVVTYNIKRGLGNDNKTDLSRSAHVLRALVPDFVGLQEVDDRTGRSGGVDQAAELGKQLKMHHAFAPFMDYQGGRYGLAVLSKYPIKSAEIVHLPTGNEPRVALIAAIRLPNGRDLKLVNIHLDWVSDDGFRFLQATKLREFLDGLTTPYILLGDFNDKPDSRTVKLLGEGAIEARKPQDDHFTFASDKPEIEIDFIFAFPQSNWLFENVRVIDEPLVSDHRPVVAKLRSR